MSFLVSVLYMFIFSQAKGEPPKDLQEEEE